ncbi:MAG: hypothetical protein ACE5I1_27515 [bacterium]
MKNKNIIFSYFVATMVVFMLDSDAYAQWKRVKHFVQKDVRVVKETKEILVLYHPVLQDSVTLSLSKAADSDIYGASEKKRGGNPYRVWVATVRFWNDPNLPRKEWGKFFHAAFLKILRSPKNAIKKQG